MTSRQFFLTVVYTFSFIAITLGVIGIIALAFYTDSASDYPGEFLLWIRETPVWMTLIYLSSLMFFKVVQEEGLRYWGKKLDTAGIWFDRLAAKF